MTRFDHVMRTAAVYAVTLFLIAPPAAQGKELASAPPARSVARKAPRLVLQVNTNEPAMMNLALKQRDQRRASLDPVNSSRAAERNHLSPLQSDEPMPTRTKSASAPDRHVALHGVVHPVSRHPHPGLGSGAIKA
jgi:hypothetical protein